MLKVRDKEPACHPRGLGGPNKPYRESQNTRIAKALVLLVFVCLGQDTCGPRVYLNLVGTGPQKSKYVCFPNPQNTRGPQVEILASPHLKILVCIYLLLEPITWGDVEVPVGAMWSLPSIFRMSPTCSGCPQHFKHSPPCRSP